MNKEQAVGTLIDFCETTCKRPDVDSGTFQILKLIQVEEACKTLRGAPKGAAQFVYGLELRDFFAATALQAVINGRHILNGPELWDASDCAEAAYKFADEMLEARKK